MASKYPGDQAIQRMFDRIAGRYDLLNRVISFRLDQRWRNAAVQAVIGAEKPLILDVGAGTGDLTFMAARAAGGRGHVVGMDFSQQMLRLAQSKRSNECSTCNVSFVRANALASPFRAEVFDGVVTAFVSRNVANLELLFAQAFKVLKPGGRLASVDMFPPSKTWFLPLYAIYFYRLVPWIGALLAGNRGAYRYLSSSVRDFHTPEAVGEVISAVGFRRVAIRKFLDGAVCLHTGQKPNGD